MNKLMLVTGYLCLSFFAACSGTDGTLDPDQDVATNEVVDPTGGIDSPLLGGTIVATYTCGAALANSAFSFDYWAAEFSDGAVWVSADIYDVNFSVSGSRVYGPNQKGSDAGVVEVVRDVASPANGGSWKVYLDRQTLITNVAYNDVDVPSGQTLWTMSVPANDCVVETF